MDGKSSEKTLFPGERPDQSPGKGAVENLGRTAYGLCTPAEKGDKEARLLDYNTGEEVTIQLDPRLSPIANAQKYFKAYNKSRIAIKHLENYLQQTNQEIEYLDSVLLAINQAENLNQLEEIVEELEKGGYLRERKVKGSGKSPVP